MPSRIAPPSVSDAKHALGPRVGGTKSVAVVSNTTPTNSSPTRHQIHHQHQLVVYLPTVWFRLAWLTMLVLQLGVATLILHYSFLLWYFSAEGMTYYVSLLGLLPPTTLARIGNSLVALCAWHLLMVARTLWASIRSRRPAFTYTTSSRDRRLVPEKFLAGFQRNLQQVYNWVWYDLLGRRGLFGVESPIFDLLFVLRELIEIGSQTYQTYRLTHLVASPWINNISTMLVIFNCVSTPVVRHFFCKSPALERTLCLTVDVLLDISASVSIPLIIFWPYYWEFNTETLGFADELMFDDVWQIRALMENRQIYMTSEVDCISKLVPLVSMISSFSGIGKLLKEKPQNAIKPHSTATVVASAGCANQRPSSSKRLAGVDRKTSQPDRVQSAMESFLTQRVASITTPKVKNRANKLVHGLFLVWAIVVGGIHLVAIKTSFGTGEEFGCKLSTRPWLGTRFSCAVLEINCHRMGLSGGGAFEVGQIMGSLEGVSLASLIISHCPELEMPSQLQQFSNLLSMEVYNSTVDSWPESAAISAQHHSAIGLLALVLCNMQELPAGVLTNLPHTLTDIAIVGSNLKTLPLDLDARWPAVSSLMIEQGALEMLPPAVGRMTSLIRLSLVGNKIAEIADDLFTDKMALFTLALSGNPLETLPASVGSVANFKTLYLDFTRVNHLPPWVLSEGFLEAVLWVTLNGTPYCGVKAKGRTASATNAAAVAASSARVQALLPLKVRCTSEKNRIGGFFPLDRVMEKRAP